MNGTGKRGITGTLRSLSPGHAKSTRVVAAVVLVGGLAAAGAGSAYAAGAGPASAYPKVTGLKVAAAAEHAVQLKWNANPAVAGTTLRVLIYNASTSAKAADATVAGTASGALVKNLPAGTALDVKVSANKSAAHAGSGWTTPVLFFTVGSTGAAGPAGPAGAAGAAGAAGERGPQGPSGVVSTGTKELVTAPTTVLTGGAFSAKATHLPTEIALGEGTYLLTVNFTAAPRAVLPGQVFPQLFVYNGKAAIDLSNNLFNVGAGGLASPTLAEIVGGGVISSYYSGTAQITVPAGGETLHVYAFGYDSGGGPGSYTLRHATMTATRLMVAS